MLLPFNEFSHYNPVIIPNFWTNTPSRIIAIESPQFNASTRPYLVELSKSVKNPYELDYRTIKDAAEFISHLKSKKGINDAPFYYISYHGQPGSIFFDKTKGLGLDDLVYPFENGGSGSKILYFSSCSILKGEDGKLLADHLLKNTNCSAVIGYTTKANWVEALFTDLIFIQKFFSHEDPIVAIDEIFQEVLRDYVPAARLGLKMFRNSTENSGRMSKHDVCLRKLFDNRGF